MISAKTFWGSLLAEVTLLASRGYGRHQYIEERVGKHSKMLEIGGSYNPMFRRDAGYNIFTADHDTQDNLIAKYLSYHPDPTKASQIQHVDFVATDGNLDTAVGSEHAGTFDFCLSSHNIEHIPNPIAHLRSIDRLIKPNGAFLMVVPDKRGCFDILRPMTTTGEWISAYQEPRPFHSKRSRFDYEGMCVGNDGSVTWGPDQVLSNLIIASGMPVINSFEHIQSPVESYTDMHAWTFTPHSMLLILCELNAVGLIGLYPHAIMSDGNGEFVVDLVKCGPIPISNEERLKLLVRACHEQAEAHMTKLDMTRYA